MRFAARLNHFADQVGRALAEQRWECPPMEPTGGGDSPHAQDGVSADIYPDEPVLSITESRTADCAKQDNVMTSQHRMTALTATYAAAIALVRYSTGQVPDSEAGDYPADDPVQRPLRDFFSRSVLPTPAITGPIFHAKGRRRQRESLTPPVFQATGNRPTYDVLNVPTDIRSMEEQSGLPKRG
jgi:hypothetical protein